SPHRVVRDEILPAVERLREDAAALSQLEQWALFQETDGFLTLHFTDCGVIKLQCGKEVGLPSDFDATRDTGWIAEFDARPLAEGATYPGDHGEHVWAFGATHTDACKALVAAIRERRVCDCARGSPAQANGT